MKPAVLLQRILPPVWFGMIVAIAMEAQLKFQAPGITRELGLGIGKIVFTWLNRVECVLAIFLLITFLIAAINRKSRFIFGAILLILLAQTFWLMPNLIERIDLIVSGQQLPASPIHLFYIFSEIFKMILLLVLTVAVNKDVFKLSE